MDTDIRQYDPASLEDDSERHLTIRRSRRVGWFALKQLFATGGKVVVATVVGSMTGRREIMAATAAPAFSDRSDRDEIWLDFIADAGDGWPATTSVAWLVGRNHVHIGSATEQVPQQYPANPEPDRPPSRAEPNLLPAGDLLVLGGDQVYPAASSRAYQTRLVDPFQSARFWDTRPRTVFAVPGNHDWYDGLTSFVRQFCQTKPRWIGGWSTTQRRSYFAIKLPHDWWLWGLDLALDDDLDMPQVDYFTTLAEKLTPQDKVILCVPNPTWLRRVSQQKAVDRQYGRLIDREEDKVRLIVDRISEGPGSGRVPVILTGDLHYYARHERKDEGGKKQEFIVCGGGGAFTLGTAAVPGTIASGLAEGADMAKTFPSAKESNRMRWGALRFPFVNFGSSLGLAAWQTLIFVAMHLGSKFTSPNWLDTLQFNEPSVSGLGALFRYVADHTSVSVPATIAGVISLALAALFARHGRSARPKTRLAGLAWLSAGLIHGIVQLLAGLLCFWIITRVIYWGVGSPSIPTAIAGFVACYFVCGFLLGAYLLLTNLFAGKMHEQEVFSSQALQTYKSFLRMRVSAAGLTIYAIGLRHVSRRWKTAPGVRVDWRDKRFMRTIEKLVVPPGTTRLYDPKTQLRPELIEKVDVT